MLHTEMKKLLENKLKMSGETKTIDLYPEEKEYMEKNQLLEEGINVIEKPSQQRFYDVYIERGDKETEDFLGEENAEFLQKSIDYFQTHKNEFMYMESKSFNLVGVDGVSFEIDDVFGTYNVLFGLKTQKKFAEDIHTFFKKELNGEAKYEMMHDGNEGIWNINFSLNDVPGFNEGLTLAEAYQLIYQLLFKLAEEVENTK